MSEATMWPSPSDYQDAIQNPRLCFEVPELREAEAARGPLGLPRVASGNFASVYELRSPRGRWAVRCFLRAVADRERHYHAISEYLDAHPLRWLVDFDYLPRGIRIRGTWYPIVTMEWVDGAPLHRHVEAVLGNRSSLLALAYQWRGLARDVRAAGMAHGDYQHGNILVTSGELRLVDYDGMFVPAFRGEKSPELGRVNYQHPERRPEDYGPELDNYSALVIYLSLRALALDPDLWKFHDGDNLVLSGADFRDPSASGALARMRAISDAEVRALAAQFDDLRHVGACDVPPLEALLATAAPAWFVGRPAEAPSPPPRADPPRPAEDRPPAADDRQERTGRGSSAWWTRAHPEPPRPAREAPPTPPAEAPGAGSRWWRRSVPADAATRGTSPSAAPGAGSPAVTLSTPESRPPAGQGGPSLAPSGAGQGGPSLASSPPTAPPARSPASAKPAGKTGKGPPAAKRAAPATRPAGRAPSPPSPGRSAARATLLALLLSLAGGIQYQTLTARVGPWSYLPPPATSPRPVAPSPAPPASPYRGRVRIPAGLTAQGVSYVLFRLNGRVAHIAERAPFTWDWDTRGVTNGGHVIEILGRQEGGAVVERRVLRVRVENPAPRQEAAPPQR